MNYEQSAVRVCNLSKSFKNRIPKLTRIRNILFPFFKDNRDPNWIIRNINFDIKRGESVGIIGINGAGKSTLLKILTGITQPTSGNVHINGRFAALLELGMGFHPDFTGIENIYMAAQLLGFSNDKIKAMIPDIESFAEIGDYIYQPLRVYSSGMQVRLAFSIATAIRPDILIIDEALSVGDSYFQHKSFDRIRKFKDLGTTLIIVSHDKQAIQSICDRAILLDNGVIGIEGNPSDVMDYYNATLADHKKKYITRTEIAGRVITKSGDGNVRIVSIRLTDFQNNEIDVVKVGEDVKLIIELQSHINIKQLVIGYMIKDRQGLPVYGTNTFHMNYSIKSLQVGESMSICFNFKAALGDGNYSIAVALHENETHLSRSYEWRDYALVFDVVNTSHPPFVGCAWIPSTIDINYETSI